MTTSTHFIMLLLQIQSEKHCSVSISCQRNLRAVDMLFLHQCGFCKNIVNIIWPVQLIVPSLGNSVHRLHILPFERWCRSSSPGCGNRTAGIRLRPSGTCPPVGKRRVCRIHSSRLMGKMKEGPLDD